MILHHKGLIIKEDLIKLKKGFKYSDSVSFTPIQYNKGDLLIQTPNMYVPFEVVEYKENNKKYIDLTFQNLCDKETKQFLDNLRLYLIK